MTSEDGPGVPEALPRVVRVVVERLDPTRVDRLWIFPPLVRGRREKGLVAASRFADDRRELYTAPYEAERTGRGLFLEMTLTPQGEAPPERLPRVMDGVVRRSEETGGEPREVDIGGRLESWQDFLDEYDDGVFEEEAKPFGS